MNFFLSEFRVGFTEFVYNVKEGDGSVTILVQASKKPEPNTSHTVQFHPPPGTYYSSNYINQW